MATAFDELDAALSEANKVVELEQPRRSWAPVDLGSVLDGERERPTPTVGARADGVGMFYPGKCHTIAGESEGGKSWLALHACLTEMDRGKNALYIDFEDDEY